MASISPTYRNGEEPPHSTTVFRPTWRRTSSFSSSPSSSWDSSFRSSSYSYNEEFSPLSPNIPLNFKGVPFSWEKIPGIPKQQRSKKKDRDSSGHLLPLPPAGTTTISATKLLHQDEISPKKSNRFKRDDPFFTALVECSKDSTAGAGDDDGHGFNSGNILKSSSKITRTLSDRFGLINMYTSCKRTCAVSESIVYLPTQSSHYLLRRRSS